MIKILCCRSPHPSPSEQRLFGCGVYAFCCVICHSSMVEFHRSSLRFYGTRGTLVNRSLGERIDPARHVLCRSMRSWSTDLKISQRIPLYVTSTLCDYPSFHRLIASTERYRMCKGVSNYSRRHRERTSNINVAASSRYLHHATKAIFTVPRWPMHAS